MTNSRRVGWPDLLSYYFDEPFFQSTSLTTKNMAPKVDIYQTPNDVVIKADVPGMTKEDISISIKEGQISISGEVKSEKTDKDTTYFRSERYSGSFNRTFMLPTEIIAEKGNAKFENGVLTITLPKQKIENKNIKINIQ